jgi:hypothetical protein
LGGTAAKEGPPLTGGLPGGADGADGVDHGPSMDTTTRSGTADIVVEGASAARYA